MGRALKTSLDFMRQAIRVSSAIFDRAITTAGLFGSLTLLPIAMLQGTATRRRVPILPAPKGEYEGYVAGVGTPIRLLAIGESSVSGIGLSRSEETVAAVMARALSRSTNRTIIWQALGISGGTVRIAIEQLLPRIPYNPIDLLVIAFGVNDATSYRSPTDYANDLVTLIAEVRSRVGDAPVVLAGVAPLNSFPALPWPLNAILGWRSKALQAAIETLPTRVTGLVVERFSMHFSPDLFADDQFHPNSTAHKLWGAEIAALALPFVSRSYRIHS